MFVFLNKFLIICKFMKKIADRVKQITSVESDKDWFETAMPG